MSNDEKPAGPCGSPLTEGLGLAPEREGQARLMTIAAGEVGRAVEISAAEVGCWYSPAAVSEMLAAERKAAAKECLSILLDGTYWNGAPQIAHEGASDRAAEIRRVFGL